MILLTGFKPFGHYRKNTSEVLIERFSKRKIDGVMTEILPVTYRDCHRFAERVKKMDFFNGILMLGMYPRGKMLRFERIAINLADSGRPDEAGVVHRWKKLIPGGPDGIFSTLNGPKIQEDFHGKGLSIKFSNSAGTYVCNALFYYMLWYFKSTQIPVGFLHVPDNLTTVKEKEMVDIIERLVNGIRKGRY